MTTFERFQGLWQVVQNLEGLRRDMRANANSYIAQAQAQQRTVQQITTIASQDASEYLRRLGWVQAIPDAVRTEFANWLPTIGLDPAELVSAYTELKAAADAQAGATPATYAQIINASNALLGMVATHYSMW